MFHTWLKNENLHCILNLETSVQFKCVWYLDSPVGFRCKFVNISVDRRIISKYSIKVRSRFNQDSETVSKSWTELLLDRLKSMKFVYKCTLKFWIILYAKECFCIQGMHWDTCLHRKLQQTTIQQSEAVSQSDC